MRSKKQVRFVARQSTHMIKVGSCRFTELNTKKRLKSVTAVACISWITGKQRKDERTERLKQHPGACTVDAAEPYHNCIREPEVQTQISQLGFMRLQQLRLLRPLHTPRQHRSNNNKQHTSARSALPGMASGRANRNAGLHTLRRGAGRHQTHGRACTREAKRQMLTAAATRNDTQIATYNAPKSMLGCFRLPPWGVASSLGPSSSKAVPKLGPSSTARHVCLAATATSRAAQHNIT